MPNQGCLPALIGIAVALSLGEAVAASDFLKRLGPGDLPYELVKMMEVQGCTASEPAMFDFLRENGADIAMAQAAIVDLARTGDIVWDKNENYTLTGWGMCP